MSKDGTLRQLERGLALIHSSWVKDLNRQLGVRMVHSQIPAGNFQHVGFTNRLLPPLSSFHALSTRQQPADFRSERLAHPGLVSCSISSQSSHDCASEESSGRSSPSKRRADSRKGLQSVAGIGPRNEQRLVSKGIESVDRLKDVFYTQKRRDEEKMLTYLQVFTTQFVLVAKPCPAMLTEDGTLAEKFEVHDFDQAFQAPLLKSTCGLLLANIPGMSGKVLPDRAGGDRHQKQAALHRHREAPCRA